MRPAEPSRRLPRLFTGRLPLRLPVLSLRSLLPRSVAALSTVVPGRALAQADGARPPRSSLRGAAPGSRHAPGADAPADADADVREARRVVEIRVEGNRRVEAEAIRRALSTQGR